VSRQPSAVTRIGSQISEMSSFASLLVICIIASTQALVAYTAGTRLAKVMAVGMFGSSPPPESKLVEVIQVVTPVTIDGKSVGADGNLVELKDSSTKVGLMDEVFPGGLQLGNIINFALIGYTAYLLVDTVRIVVTKGQ